MPRKLTHEEFMAKFEEKQPELFAKTEVLGEYVNIDTKIKCRCKIDGYEWETRPKTLLKGHGCPQCGGVVPYTTESFKIKMKEINPNIEILGEYINNHTKIKCRCLIDGYEWEALSGNLLQGHGCPKCGGQEAYTTNLFIEKIKMVNPNIEVLGEYVNSKTPILCRCKIDNYQWNPTPNALLSGRGCPKCGKNISDSFEEFNNKFHSLYPNSFIKPLKYTTYPYVKCVCLIDGYEWEPTVYNLLKGYGCPMCSGLLKKTHEQFVEELKEINPNIEILEEYINNHTKIKCRCLIDGNEWETTPKILLGGSGCPKCAHSSTSWLQEELFNYFSQNYPSTLYRDRTLIGKELDIVIPELNIAIEPGGWHWHFEFENRLPNDYQKQLLCKEKGYRCITLYDACDFPDALWYPALVYDMDIGQHKELLQDVIDDIEGVISELNTQKEVFKNEYESH